jgi:hypothetical protein
LSHVGRAHTRLQQGHNAYVKSSASPPKRDRTERLPGTVFLAAVGSVGFAMMVGFGLLFSACADSLSHLASGGPPAVDDVQPIPIPHASCPYLRLVAGAATNAGAPWHDTLSGSASLARMVRDLPAPLAALDLALAAAIPNVPGPVARDLREVRHDVQIGRVELLAATSADDYLNRSKVLEGYATLVHASRLVGDACGAAIAPPLPF